MQDQACGLLHCVSLTRAKATINGSEIKVGLIFSISVVFSHDSVLWLFLIIGK